MKLVPVVPALAALVVVACSANSKQATAPQRAAHHAEEEKQEAQEEAQDARKDATKARQEAQEATLTQRTAEQNAQGASQRAALAEAQAAQPPPSLHEGTTERQTDHASSPRGAKRSVFFEANSAELTPDAKLKLDEVARGLSNNTPGSNVVVEGYSDDTGVESDNVQLSHRRADAVANYLQSKGGIHGERITTKGLGSRNLASKEETNRGRALNRRVEIVTQTAAK
jgi:outer membrane protein OmpA-like peptidoglycan-associated protein